MTTVYCNIAFFINRRAAVGSSTAQEAVSHGLHHGGQESLSCSGAGGCHMLWIHITYTYMHVPNIVYCSTCPQKFIHNEGSQMNWPNIQLQSTKHTLAEPHTQDLSATS